MSERGAASSVLLSMLALMALFSLALADAGNVLLARSRAQKAADAAALAAAVAQWPFLRAGSDPPAAATEVAEANGARLEVCECPVRGREAFVEVTVPTRIRMLGTAPSRVRGRATAAVDPGALFR